jgi:hypothetical protein
MDREYDIILGNPPQEGARKETGRQDLFSWATRVQRVCVKYFQTCGLFGDLQQAWDFSLPFVSCSLKMLAETGFLAMILPRAVGTQKFSRKFLRLNAHHIRRVTYFTAQAGHLFYGWDESRQRIIGIGNDFLVFVAVKMLQRDVAFDVAEISSTDFTDSPTSQVARNNQDFSKFYILPPHAHALPGIPLRLVATVTKGATLCARAESRRTRGSFKIRDLVTPLRDSNHPIRLVEPTHIAPFSIIGESYLEFRHANFPHRVPESIHRWREDGFFQGPVLVTPLSKQSPSFAIVPPDFDLQGWRAPETVVLFKRWVDWFEEFPGELPPAIAKMVKIAQKDIDATEKYAEFNDSLNLREELLWFSRKYSLGTLAMILSSRPVHECRLENAKSFGKFEVGDWEDVNLPNLNTDEASELDAIYNEIFNLIADLSIYAKETLESNEVPSWHAKKRGSIAAAFENSFFKANDTPLLNALPAIDPTILVRIREILTKSEAIIVAAYARNSD